MDNLSALETGAVRSGAPVEILRGDVVDGALCREAMVGVDGVLHEAARVNVPRSIEDPARSYEVNVQGTLQLLEAARSEGVERFVMAASSAAYGNSETLPKHEGDGPVAPVSLRVGEGRRGAPAARLRGVLRNEDRGAALLQRLRPAPGRRQPLHRRHRDLRARAPRRAHADDLRRRGADAGLHVHRQRRRREPRGVDGRGRARRGHQRRRRRADQPQPALPRHGRSARRVPDARLRRRARRGRASQPRLGGARAGTARLQPTVSWEEGLARTVAWYRDRKAATSA